MYTSRTVCSRCSSQLRSIAAQRLGNRVFLATLADGAESSQGGASTAGNTQQGRPQRPWSHRKSREASQESAVALFRDVVNPAASAQAIDEGPTRSILEEWEVAGKLRELVESDMALEKQYQTFQATIWPHVRELRIQLPRHLFKSTFQFLLRVKEAAQHTGTLVNSIELSQMLSIIGKFDLDIRNDLVLGLCYHITHDEHTPDEQLVLVNELVDLWKHISQLKRVGEIDQSPHFALPTAEEVQWDIDQQMEWKEQGTAKLAPVTKALSAMFLQYKPDQVKDIMPGLLATLAVLSDTRYIQAREEARPLLHLVSIALAQYRVDDVYINSVFETTMKLPPAKLVKVKSYILRQWDHVVSMLSSNDADRRTGVPGTANPHLERSFDVATISKHIEKAYRSRNTGAAHVIWEDFRSRLQQQPQLAEQVTKETKFMDYWVFVWCALRKPKQIQETIELMGQLGMPATVKTYTAMMHGWKICKDAAKIQALWAQLVQSGMKLDLVIWTERISGLIESKQPQEGILALGEMVAAWRQATKDGRPDTAVQPSIEVVNAAVHALLRRDPTAAHEILSWAGREGIEPDIRTYNILLGEALRNGNSEDAAHILSAMKAQGIDPDTATYTVIIKEAIGGMMRATTEEQVRAVKRIFADMETAKLRPTMETYGKMLYAITGLEGGGSKKAIDEILAHMRRYNHVVTPHMITILIERALARDPPDIAEVRVLLQEYEVSSTNEGDQTLWERVMSGFSKVGEKDEAMAIFNKLAGTGRPVTSLVCLKDLLMMLLRKQDRENAQRVVDVVLEYKLEQGEEADGRYWKHRFWFLARESGLLIGRKLPPVPQGS